MKDNLDTLHNWQGTPRDVTKKQLKLLSSKAPDVRIPKAQLQQRHSRNAPGIYKVVQ